MKKELYYRTLERLQNHGFRCDCDPNKPTPGCIICDPAEHDDIMNNPKWMDWIKEE